VNGALWESYWGGTTSYIWQTVNLVAADSYPYSYPYSELVGPVPLSALVYEGGVFVFAVGSNGSVVESACTATSGCNPYAPDGWMTYPVSDGTATFPQGGGVAAIVGTNNDIEVYAVDVDGGLWEMSCSASACGEGNGAGWTTSAVSSMTCVLKAGAALGVIYEAANQMEVYQVDQSGTLCESWGRDESSPYYSWTTGRI
jgi:hypothetical protein